MDLQSHQNEQAEYSQLMMAMFLDVNDKLIKDFLMRMKSKKSQLNFPFIHD